MTTQAASDLAKELIAAHGHRNFEVSMPDKASYELMRIVFADLGRETGPDGEFFVVKVFAGAGAKPHER